MNYSIYMSMLLNIKVYIINVINDYLDFDQSIIDLDHCSSRDPILLNLNMLS